MSLKEEVGMLGIDSPHGRYQTDQPGADASVRGRRWRGRVSGRRPGREVRLRGADFAAAGSGQNVIRIQRRPASQSRFRRAPLDLRPERCWREEN